jgi:hypothetical protein
MLKQFKFANDIILGSQEYSKSNDDYDALLNDCKGIPFYRYELTEEEHSKLRNDCRTDRGNSTCCFWDLTGRPIKHNEEKPLFDYQQIILNALEYFKKIRIKKFRGAGVTEQFLRYGAWLSLSSNQYRNKKAFIITGITQELSNDHILRLRNLFLNYYPGAIEQMEYAQKTITINESLFRAYPAGNPEAPRGKTDVFFILADEFDHHTRRQQEDMMSVITPYRPKTDTLIVLNSTTKNPEGLYVEMDKEWMDFLESLNMKGVINQKDLLLIQHPDYLQTIKQNIKHHYFLLEFDWLWGLHKIYTQKEIDEVKEDRTFQGEFCLRYAGTEGNVFSPSQIDKAIELGEQFKHLPLNPYSITAIGCDVGFGSSNTAVVATQFLKEESKIRIIYAQEWQHGDPQAIVNLIFNLHLQYGTDNTFIFVDGSNRAFVNLAKVTFGESLNWEKSITKPSPNNMKVIPCNFSTDHKQMLSHLAMMVSKSYLAIPASMDKLIISLRTAYSTELSLDKERTSYSDSLDALRLACKMYKMK